MYRVYTIPVGYLKVNCYLLADEATGDAFVIDPGDEADRIADFARGNAAHIKGILITHAHFDHVGACDALADLCDCPVYVTAEEVASVDNHPPYERMMHERYQSLVKAYAKHGRPITAEEELPLGRGFVRVLSVPGHSVSGTCFYCPDDGLLFSGDTLFAGGSYGREDFYLAQCGGRPVLRDNIERTLFSLPSKTRVLPGHGEETTIGAER